MVSSLFGGKGAATEARKPEPTATVRGSLNMGSTGEGTISRGSKKQHVMPRPLGGKLEVMGGVFGTYVERNFVIKTTDSSLKYYKAGESTGVPVGSLDLRQVEKIVFDEKAGKRDPLRFNIILQVGKEGLQG